MCFCSRDSNLSYRSCISIFYVIFFSNISYACWGILCLAAIISFCVSALVTAIYLTGFICIAAAQHRDQLLPARLTILVADWLRYDVEVHHSGRRLRCRDGPFSSPTGYHRCTGLNTELHLLLSCISRRFTRRSAASAGRRPRTAHLQQGHL